jgi:hypothetical protein
VHEGRGDGEEKGRERVEEKSLCLKIKHCPSYVKEDITI